MSLESITQVNVDFYNDKYITINAKQYDKSSRFIEVTCYDHGVLFPINSNKHSAYIRYKKADEYSVFNECNIVNEKILVELTEQMLAASGICYADLIVVKDGSKKFDANTGEMIGVDGSSILSTMKFHINVFETAVENSEIESSYEYNSFNKTLEEMNASCEDIIKLAKSWAEGETGVRDDEYKHNAKYWAEVAAQNATGTPIVVTGIKGDKETDYRSGQVNITANNVGAIPIENMATVDEVKNYLGI